jgi:rSAM/selenodomain-associated transferase 2
MTITVIIPTLNEEQTIEHTLSRLHDPAFSEILVVDGGSQDQTLARVATAAPHARILSGTKGRARQMNSGAAASKEDVLLFLHADTLLPLTAASDVTTALQDPRTIGGRFDVRFDRDSGWYWLICRMMNWRSRLTGIVTGDQALFVRRPVFVAVGGFPDIPVMEDIALSKQLKRVGRIAALKSCVLTSSRRWTRQGVVRTILLMWWMRLLFFVGVSPEKLKRLYIAAR